MDVELRHGFTADVDVFYLLWGNIFTLSQFKDVLLPVDDLQCAVLMAKQWTEEWKEPSFIQLGGKNLSEELNGLFFEQPQGHI